MGWIRKGYETKVIEICTISLSIGKYYQDEVACNAIEMDACQILLGRTWQFEKGHITKREKEHLLFPVEKQENSSSAPNKRNLKKQLVEVTQL